MRFLNSLAFYSPYGDAQRTDLILQTQRVLLRKPQGAAVGGRMTGLQDGWGAASRAAQGKMPAWKGRQE